MASLMVDSYREKKQSTYQSDDSWLFSPGNWIYPDSNSMSKYTSYHARTPEEELHLFGGRYDINQPLIGKKRQYVLPSPRFFTFLSFGILISVALGFMTMLPCPTGAAINKIFKFTDTKSGIDILPGQDIQEALYHNKTFKVVLLGDSLINKPYVMFDLAGKIKAYLPGYNLELSNCGSNGAVIAGIYSDLIPNCVIPVSPDAVLILWDSDVSDVNEDDLDTQGKTELRSAYQLNLIKAIDLLVKTGAYIALAGPGVLGEGLKAFSPDEDRFTDKEEMLEDYKLINKDVVSSFNIPYIDVRQAFLDYIPKFQLCYSLCVTFDGEHENERGTIIVAKLFATNLSKWLISYKG